MSRGPDASTLLKRALLLDARVAGCVVTVPAAHMTRWASATFTGAQHRMMLEAEDSTAFGTWICKLSEANVPLRGHLLADLIIVSSARRDCRAIVVIEALTVED